MLIGGAAALSALMRGGGASAFSSLRLAPLFFVVVGIAAFSILIDSHGLIPAVTVLVLCSCYNRLRTRPLEVAIIAIILVAATALLFTYALPLPLNLF
jgi:hypothetical protein